MKSGLKLPGGLELDGEEVYIRGHGHKRKITTTKNLSRKPSKLTRGTALQCVV
jgi:hypothetical protein